MRLLSSRRPATSSVIWVSAQVGNPEAAHSIEIAGPVGVAAQ
ncbi:MULTISPECIES: hypothetical protein [Nocardia]|nr:MULTISPECIES: hypothetical protein [Nocardia]